MSIDGRILVIVLTVWGGWLLVLTIVVARRRADPDEPVYRRLPDGRIRFEWSVGAAYHAARRVAASETPDPADGRNTDEQAREGRQACARRSVASG